ncbi:MAG: respiratory nitrate reductase subunit gamma, partial [Reyranellales bacterium]
MSGYIHQVLFGYYPYFCVTVFLLGSLVRFDREQYTWRSGSSQLIEPGLLRWGSNLFHIGILFLLAGHTVGLLTPHAIYEHFVSAADKQMLAIVSGGIAGAICFVGLTMLLYRRLVFARVRATST